MESQTGDCEEPNYIESNNFTPKDSESHSRKIPCELFCVTGNDTDFIDIYDLY